ncbi:MAG: hypothetical protein AAGB46_15390 [Verrucomicrobiota bacterium]
MKSMISCQIGILVLAIASLSGCASTRDHRSVTETTIMPERLKLFAVDSLEARDRSSMSVHELASYGSYALRVGEFEMAASYFDAAMKQTFTLDADSKAQVAVFAMKAGYWSNNNKLAMRAVDELDGVRASVQVNTAEERNWAFIVSRRFDVPPPIWAKPTGALRSVFAKRGPWLTELQFTQGLSSENYDEGSLQATIALFMREKIERGEATEAYQAVLLQAQILRLEQRVFLPFGNINEVSEDALMQSLLEYVI